MSTEKKTARLENWHLTMFATRRDGDLAYSAPEQFYSCFCGDAYGYPGVSDGTQLTTGSIVAWHPESRTVETKRTMWVLGTISTEYAAEYEDAEARLFKALDSSSPNSEGRLQV